MIQQEIGGMVATSALYEEGVTTGTTNEITPKQVAGITKGIVTKAEVITDDKQGQEEVVENALIEASQRTDYDFDERQFKADRIRTGIAALHRKRRPITRIL